jgi:Uma2 family endonuclease
MTQAIRKIYAPQEYLALEEKALYKSEYFRGEIFQMAGATGRHNQISANIVTILNNALFDKDCIVYPSDMRILVQANGLYTYADALVVCGEVAYIPNREDTLTNPILITEVLSPSTRNYDKGDKFTLYQELESFKVYLIIEQSSIRVDYYCKRDDGSWQLRTYTNLENIIEIEPLAIDLPLSRIYNKVKLPEKSSRPKREKLKPHPDPSNEV